MKRTRMMILAGSAAGFANGLFGGGGGMVLLPLLRRHTDLPDRKLYATCVGVIFPACAVSAAVYLLQGQAVLQQSVPYLIGGLVGGWLGGRLYGRVPTSFLRYLFAAFLFYAGVKYLL